MELKDAIAAVEKSKEYAEFAKAHPKAYLAHAFSMEKPEDAFKWEFGYYAPDTKKIIVFETDPVHKKPEDDVYSENIVKKLDPASVKISPEEARRIALDLKQKTASAEMVTKLIVILQNLDVQVYNFTLVTHTFNIYNIRVDAASGEVVSSEMRSIMSLRRDV